jgi:hypothetical protein
LLEKKLNEEYPIEHDIFLFDYRNDVIKSIEKIFNIDMSKKYPSLSEIKKLYPYKYTLQYTTIKK